MSPSLRLNKSYFADDTRAFVATLDDYCCRKYSADNNFRVTDMKQASVCFVCVCGESVRGRSANNDTQTCNDAGVWELWRAFASVTAGKMPWAEAALEKKEDKVTWRVSAHIDASRQRRATQAGERAYGVAAGAVPRSQVFAEDS